MLSSTSLACTFWSSSYPLLLFSTVYSVWSGYHKDFHRGYGCGCGGCQPWKWCFITRACWLRSLMNMQLLKVTCPGRLVGGRGRNKGTFGSLLYTCTLYSDKFTNCFDDIWSLKSNYSIWIIIFNNSNIDCYLLSKNSLLPCRPFTVKLQRECLIDLWRKNK